MVGLFALFRFHDELTEKGRERRLLALKRAYHPSLPRRLKRRIRNVFNTFKDAISDSMGMVMTRAKTVNPALAAVSQQDKYLSRVQGDVMGSVGSSYDPILERHIGKMVVLEIGTTAGETQEHVGVFKEYSPEYLEVMDVKYKDGEQERVCDMVVPRATSFIRHSAERLQGEVADELSKPLKW